jgi:FkbM family methyltransferase
MASQSIFARRFDFLHRGKSAVVSKLLYSKELPMNYNWCSDRRLYTFFEKLPITLLDCGARGSVPPELEPISRFLKMIAIDADETATIVSSDYKDFVKIPKFLDESEKSIPFYLYKRRGESSSLLPDPRYISSFSPSTGIESSKNVEAIDLDTLLGEKAKDIDFIKLDVQGTESRILRGASRTLGQSLFVEIEISFVRQYLGQDLWFHIGAAMDERGFEPLYLNRVFANRVSSPQPSKGQLLFGDMIFVPKPDRIQELSPTKKRKLILLLIHFGHRDIAFDYLHTFFDELDDFRTEMLNLFPNFSKSPSNVMRILVGTVVDRIILFYLRARKSNGFAFDSDRSWPYR